MKIKSSKSDKTAVVPRKRYAKTSVDRHHPTIGKYFDWLFQPDTGHMTPRHGLA